ncbi:MAG: hypothetical protein JW735_09165 [Prolixibacteraceae bacterium]|nr:hypothetical protein [Prolixibacteraceae bacterium]
MADIANVKVGACSVTFNDVDLGHTKGGVEISYEPVYHDVSVDKYGESIVEKYLVGEKWSVKVPLAELTIANLKVAMPQGTFAGAANARLTLGHSAGTKATTSAAQLVLHPLNMGTRANDIVLHKAYVASTVDLAMKVDEENIVEVTFEALVDETKSDGNYLGLIGDSTA